MYLNDLYCLPEYTDICNFVHDITFHACDKDLNSLINRLEHDSLLVIEWFENNNMKLSAISLFQDINMKMNLSLLVS